MRDVAEVAAAFVMEQVIAAHSGYVNIVAAIVIVIADSDAHAVDFDIQTAAVRNIRKRSVTVVAIEGRCGVAAMWNPVAAVDEKNIGAAIAIRIEECDTGTHGFRQPFLTGASCVLREMNPGGSRYVCEAHRNRGRISGLGCDWSCQTESRHQRQRR